MLINIFLFFFFFLFRVRRRYWKKRRSQNFRKFHRKIPVLESLFNKVAGPRPIVKYCCVLAIAEYFYTNKTDLCFFFASIESVEKSLKYFFVFSRFFQVVFVFSRSLFRGFA